MRTAGSVLEMTPEVFRRRVSYALVLVAMSFANQEKAMDVESKPWNYD